jgi:hypothetical protein
MFNSPQKIRSIALTDNPRSYFAASSNQIPRMDFLPNVQTVPFLEFTPVVSNEIIGFVPVHVAD